MARAWLLAHVLWRCCRTGVTIVKVDVDTIGAEGLDMNAAVPKHWVAEVLGSNSEFHPMRDGQIEVHLTRMDDDVHVRGQATWHLGATCSRCLGEANVALQTPLECVIVPRSVEPRAGEDGELNDASMDVATYDNHEIDLNTVMRDEVLLELPMRALCSSACAGLCTHCGKNLNDETCACVSIDIAEGPFGALKRIKLTET